MLEKIDLNQKLDKKTFKRIMPVLRNRLYVVQKTSWDAGIPVIILYEGWDAAGKGTSIQKLTRPIDPRLQAVSDPRCSHLREETSLAVALLVKTACPRRMGDF